MHKIMKMEFVKKLGLVVAVFAFMISCGGKGKNGNAYISGTITNGGEQTLYLEELTPEKIVMLDSVKLGKDGSFSIKKRVGAINYYRLRLGKEQTANMYATPNNVIVFISDSSETLTVQADGKAMNSDFKVSGSKETDLLTEINNYLIKGEKTIDSLNQIYQETPEKFNQAEGERIFNEVTISRTAYMKNFALNHLDNFVVLQALPFLNPDQDLDVFKKVNESLTKKFPMNGWVINLGKRIEQLSFLAPGTEAPDFTILTPEDKNISLKDFRGKFVLVDFWASWCKPCRAENPNVVATYNKFKGKGFTIFGVSLDQNKEAWISAIKSDGLVWQHGSDLKYWDAAPAKLYNVSSIPYNILIDKEGKIVAKNLHGADLENQLTAVLK
jgi:peroxiredoxin